MRATCASDVSLNGGRASERCLVFIFPRLHTGTRHHLMLGKIHLRNKAEKYIWEIHLRNAVFFFLWILRLHSQHQPSSDALTRLHQLHQAALLHPQLWVTLCPQSSPEPYLWICEFVDLWICRFADLWHFCIRSEWHFVHKVLFRTSSLYFWEVCRFWKCCVHLVFCRSPSLWTVGIFKVEFSWIVYFLYFGPMFLKYSL